MRYYLMLFFTVIITVNISAQPFSKITCKLLSAEDERPVESASIMSKNGVSISLISDQDGLFEIQAVSGTVLSISHAEFFTLEILIDTIKNSPYIIHLKPKSQLLENIVINTGYEKIEMHKATGSYLQVDNTLFNRSVATSVMDHLDGVTNSLYFDKREGAAAPLQIRGISTLGYASTKPLIVLDNFPYEGDIENINPADVENVTILRDAAATSIWGARAGNGVIVINTKKGSKNKPLSLSINANKLIQPKPDLFSIDKISTSDYIDMEKFLFSKGYFDSKLTNPRDYSPLTPVVYILEDQRAGKINEKEAEDKINSLRNLDVRNDFLKYIYQPAISNTLGISFSGGGRQSTYYFSANGDESLASLKGNKNSRINISSKASFEPLKKLRLDAEISYARRTSTLKNQIGYGNLIAKSNTELYPYAQLADEFGNPLIIEKNYKVSFLDTLGKGQLLDWKYRPLEELNYYNNTTINNSMIVNTGVHFELTPFLNLEAKYQFQQELSINNTAYDVKSYNARTWINQYTVIDDQEIKYGVPVGDIVYKGNSQTITQNVRGQINFNKDFNKDVNVTAVAGGEIRSSDFSSNQFQMYGVDKNLNWINIDPVNRTPSLYNLFGSGYIPNGISVKETSLRFLSAYSSASVSYKKLYTLSSSIRYDASNLFGVKTNQKGVPLWSTGFAVNISDYKNYKLDWLPLLKFRSTIGFSGNLSPERSAVTIIYHAPGADQPITQLPYATVDNYPNHNLRWEKVRTINFGLDFILYDNRIRGSFDYYLKKSTDVLAPEELDPTKGTTYFYTNSANLRGSGFDLSISSVNIRTGFLSWKSNFLLSRNKSLVTRSLYNQNPKGKLSDGLDFVRIEGHEVFEIISYSWAGLNELGNPQGYIGNRVSTNYDSLRTLPVKDQVVSGNSIPRIYGSFRNDILYKSFELSFNLRFNLQYSFRKPALSYSDLVNNGKGYSEFQNRWKNPGDEVLTNVPSFVYPLSSSRDLFYKFAEINVLRGDNIRFDDIRLSYRIKNKIFTSTVLYLMASNLNIILWKANESGIDPEFPSGLKSLQSYNIGLKINY